MKKILKFKDIIKTVEMLDVPAGELKVTMSNIDDVFTVLKEKGINEIIVDWSIMLMIAKFTIVNINLYANNPDDYNWQALKIIQEGKIDKFLGVKLYLND